MKNIIHRSTIIAAGLLTLATLNIEAQLSAPSVRIRPIVGAFLPTGQQSDLLKKSVLLGAQLGLQLGQNIAITGTVGWAPSKDRTLLQTAGALAAEDKRLDVYQYDLGLEARLPVSTGLIEATPYIGGGVGGRTYVKGSAYEYGSVAWADAQTNLSGYGAVGLDVAPLGSPLGIRFEARDNISRFKGLRGELAKSVRRNDVAITTGLTWKF